MRARTGKKSAMPTIGSRLREERRRRGLKLAEVWSATLIPERHLAALEEDRFDLLPAGSYRRSFLRGYADYLGLNGDALVDEYQQQVDADAPLHPAPPGPRRAGSGLTRVLQSRELGRGFALGAVLLVIVIVWQLGAFSNNSAVKTPPARIVRHAPARASTHSAARSRPPRVVPRLSRPRPRPSLALTAARGPCWLQVRIGSSSGRAIYEQTLQRGQTVRFGLRTPLWIRVGAPSNLELTLAGRHLATPRSNSGALLAASSGLKPGAP
jgi:hypothetical protein